jgi:hypothetical protein
MTEFGNLPVGSPVSSCPFTKKPEPAYWIEIELVGEDDRPIPWEEYLVVLPDGRPAKGYLDEDGFARLQGIAQDGSCTVIFPGLDEKAWAHVQTLPERTVQE